MYKGAENMAPEEVLVTTFYSMAGQTSVSQNKIQTTVLKQFSGFADKWREVLKVGG